MKKWAYRVPLKALCVFLAVVSFVCCALSALCICVMIDRGGYRVSFETLRKDFFVTSYEWIPSELAYRYHENVNGEASFYSWLSLMELEYGFRCSIFDAGGRTLYSDYGGEDYLYRVDILETVSGTWETTDYNGTPSSDGKYMTWQEEEYRVIVYYQTAPLSSNEETVLWVLEVFYTLRYAAIAIFFSTLALFAVLMVFLCCAAGRRGDEEGVREDFFTRIFLEIYLLFALFLLLFQVWFLQSFPSAFWLWLLAGGAFVVMDSLFLVLFIMNLAIRIKSGNFSRYTIFFHFVKLLKKGGVVGKHLYENVSLAPKVVLILLLVAVFDLFLATVLDFTEFLAAILVEGIAMMAILVWYAASIQRLLQDQQHLAKGELDHRCDVLRLPPGLRSFGEAFNRSAEGMERAVEEKMKSERFKTELITNVSHDIKTPLTSIINYVDLMKKEEVANENITEYLEVLDRQSARLKKLTEDLVESSKAASGVIPVELVPCDLKVLLEQAWGEYASSFEEKGLIPCLSSTEESCFALADGKRLWRVLDNLMNNICKYALSGTRVYGTLEETDEQVRIIFRNISSLPLNLSGEDLMERFVRGDASRNTEGSGLGLAIARSLVELQKGTMKIFVDGDLFRVTIAFDRIQ